jgi:hypothetical protein
MNTENFYNQWLGLVRKNAPSLENPEAMTASVMGKIENLPDKTSGTKITYCMSILSGAAACLLFCLLIYEYNRPLVNLPDRPIAAVTGKSPLPEKVEDIPHFLKEKHRQASVYRKLRTQLAEKYSYLSYSKK